jgi:hypothetical protein
VRSFRIARMGVDQEPLPQRQFWVGKLTYRGALLTVTLTLFGEAALSVVCTHLLPELA